MEYIDAKSPIVLKKYSLKVEAYEIYLLSNVSEINENAIYCKVKNVYISNNVRKITGEIFYNDNTGYLGTEITTNVYCESEKIIPGWPSNEYLGLISLKIDWFDLLVVQEILKRESSPAPQLENISSLAFRLLYGPVLTSIHDYWKNHNVD